MGQGSIVARHRLEKKRLCFRETTHPYQGQGIKDLKALLVFHFFPFEKYFEKVDGFNVLASFHERARKTRVQFHSKVVMFGSSKQVLVF